MLKLKYTLCILILSINGTFKIGKISREHGIKRFVIPTKSFVKIGAAKIFCYNNKMFCSINKPFGSCSNIFGCSNKKLFVIPNFVAVTKPFFSVKRFEF